MKRILAILILLFSLGYFVNLSVSLKQQNLRLSKNQEALLSSVNSYKADSLSSAASIAQLSLTVREFENSNLILKKEIANLNIELDRVNSASVVGTESNYEIKTILKDSLIIRDSIVFIAPCINYTTPYVSLQGCIIDSSSFEGSIKTSDSIIRIEHRVPKRFLFIKFGTKLVKEEYISKNPHTNILNAETVVIVDKKGKNK